MITTCVVFIVGAVVVSASSANAEAHYGGIGLVIGLVIAVAVFADLFVSDLAATFLLLIGPIVGAAIGVLVAICRKVVIRRVASGGKPDGGVRRRYMTIACTTTMVVLGVSPLIVGTCGGVRWMMLNGTLSTRVRIGALARANKRTINDTDGCATTRKAIATAGNMASRIDQHDIDTYRANRSQQFHH